MSYIYEQDDQPENQIRSRYWTQILSLLRLKRIDILASKTIMGGAGAIVWEEKKNETETETETEYVPIMH